MGQKRENRPHSSRRRLFIVLLVICSSVSAGGGGLGRRPKLKPSNCTPLPYRLQGQWSVYLNIQKYHLPLTPMTDLLFLFLGIPALQSPSPTSTCSIPPSYSHVSSLTPRESGKIIAMLPVSSILSSVLLSRSVLRPSLALSPQAAITH